MKLLTILELVQNRITIILIFSLYWNFKIPSQHFLIFLTFSISLIFVYNFSQGTKMETNLCSFLGLSMLPLVDFVAFHSCCDNVLYFCLMKNIYIYIYILSFNFAMGLINLFCMFLEMQKYLKLFSLEYFTGILEKHVTLQDFLFRRSDDLKYITNNL